MFLIQNKVFIINIILVDTFSILIVVCLSQNSHKFLWHLILHDLINLSHTSPTFVKEIRSDRMKRTFISFDSL